MFDFEKLDVYTLALEFCQDVDQIVRGIPQSEYSLIDQLKRACMSIPLNIAEGSGRWHNRERKQYYFISRGSVFECVSLLTLMNCKGLLDNQKHIILRQKLERLTQMLTKLGNKFGRARETST